ncbi:MAG: GNAT family N-acetyltransferase [Bacteroidetes bacterium]|nr:GNAT family N-acetyltransferase [Bacteroidota bacterium]
MKVISVDPAADPRWLAFLNHMPEATLFYHPSWMKTLDEAYGYPQCCLGVEENGEIIGVLPLMEIDSWITGKRGVCLPFTDSCGPLTVTPDATALLLDTLASDRRRRGWKYAEVRTRADHPGARQTAEYKYHRLMVSGDVQSMFSRLNKKRTQWSIQKAESSRVVVERRTDREALDEFVRLNDLTRRKHGIPPQPRRFFESLHRHIIAQGLGFVNLATVDGVVAAGSVWLAFNRTLIHKYSASDVRYLKACPNHAVVWDAIKWAIANAMAVVDFGRSDLEGEGLIKFKQSWGSEESDLTYVRWSDSAPRQGQDVMHSVEKALRHMPLPILRLAGRVMYRHIG